MPTAHQVYAMLENASLWQTATQCHYLLAAALGDRVELLRQSATHGFRLSAA